MRFTEKRDSHSSDLPLPTNLLTEVEEVYAHLATCLAEMRQVTSGPTPDRSRYTRARYRISNASLRRRQLFHDICRQLEPRLSPGDARRLRALLQNDREYLRHSAGYVTKWTPEAAFASWRSYSQEAKEIQRHMEEVADEQMRVLTPLLMQYGFAGRRSCHLAKANDVK